MPIGEQLTTTTTTTQSDAYHNFVIHVRNAATRLNYVCKLNRFLKYCRLEEENNSYNGLLFDNDNKLIQSRITDFLIHIQAAGLSSATVRQHVTALRFFYEMNDITTLNWRKIGKTLSEYKKVANDRPYTRQEITKML